MSAITGALCTIIFIAISGILPDPEVLLPGVPPILTTGLVPFLIMAATMWLFMKYLKRRWSLNRPEMIQSVIVLLVVSYAVLTVTGIFFRGEGMNLVWPWNL
jgi:hypothetical protein